MLHQRVIYHNHNKAHADLETDVPSLPFLCCLILSSIKRKPLGHPLPDARLCRGAPPRCAHRDGVDAESGTGRRVTFWHCKGSIPSQLRQRPSSRGAPRPQASFLVSQPVCAFVRACSAAVPCCTRRLSILVQRRAKRIGETLHLLQSRGCLSVCTAAQRYKRCGSVSNITAASKSGCVCGFWCDAALSRTRQGWMGPSCIILGCHLRHSSSAELWSH